MCLDYPEVQVVLYLQEVQGNRVDHLFLVFQVNPEDLQALFLQKRLFLRAKNFQLFTKTIIYFIIPKKLLFTTPGGPGSPLGPAGPGTDFPSPVSIICGVAGSPGGPGGPAGPGGPGFPSNPGFPGGP